MLLAPTGKYISPKQRIYCYLTNRKVPYADKDFFDESKSVILLWIALYFTAAVSLLTAVIINTGISLFNKKEQRLSLKPLFVPLYEKWAQKIDCLNQRFFSFPVGADCFDILDYVCWYAHNQHLFHHLYWPFIMMSSGKVYFVEHMACFVNSTVWTAWLNNWFANSNLIPAQFC